MGGCCYVMQQTASLNYIQSSKQGSNLARNPTVGICTTLKSHVNSIMWVSNFCARWYLEPIQTKLSKKSAIKYTDVGLTCKCTCTRDRRPVSSDLEMFQLFGFNSNWLQLLNVYRFKLSKMLCSCQWDDTHSTRFIWSWQHLNMYWIILYYII